VGLVNCPHHSIGQNAKGTVLRNPLKNSPKMGPTEREREAFLGRVGQPHRKGGVEEAGYLRTKKKESATFAGKVE